MNPSENYITSHFVPAGHRLNVVSSFSPYQSSDPNCHLPVNCPPPTNNDDMTRQYGMFHEMHPPSHRNDSPSSCFYDSYHGHGHTYAPVDSASSSNIDWMSEGKSISSSNTFIYNEHVNDSNLCAKSSCDVSTYYPDESFDSGMATVSSGHWAYHSPVRNAPSNAAVSHPASSESKNTRRRANTDHVNLEPAKMRKHNQANERAKQKCPQNQSERFAMTVEFLKSCNLYDITMKTFQFIEQNSQLQEQIDLFRGEITTILAPSFINRL